MTKHQAYLALTDNEIGLIRKAANFASAVKEKEPQIQTSLK